MSTVTNTRPAADPVGAAPPGRAIALITILLASFMDLLDNTIVNVALPPIQRDLHAPYSSVQWVAAGYTLAFAVLLITGGRLGDIFGRKRMFLIGVAGFSVASALCGLSGGPDQLIAARVAQGAMGAMMVPQVLSILQVLFAPKERGRAMAAFGGLAGLATVGGPILGALLTSGNIAGLGWRAVFWVNVPVGLLTLVAALVTVPESRASAANRLDLPGVALVSAGLLLLTYPLIQGRDLGWPAWTYVSMAASVPVLAVFVAYQRRRTRSPLVQLRMFRFRSFTGGLLVSLLFMAGAMGYFLIFALYLQLGLGYSVMHAGLTGIPWGLAVPLFAGVSMTLLAPKLGRRGMQLGIGLDIVAMFCLMWTVHHFGAAVSSWDLAPGLFIGGTGMGLVVATLFDFALSDVPVDDAGSASGVLNTAQQLGGALGVAVTGVVFFHLLGSRPPHFVPAFQHTLWCQAGLFLAAGLATLLLPRRATHHEPGH